MNIEPETHTRILNIATEIVTGDRNGVYGDPTDSHAEIAKYWSALFGVEVTAHQVAIAMMLLKVVRATRSSEYHEDSYVDMAGYAAIAGRIREGKKRPHIVPSQMTLDNYREYLGENASLHDFKKVCEGVLRVLVEEQNVDGISIYDKPDFQRVVRLLKDINKKIGEKAVPVDEGDPTDQVSRNKEYVHLVKQRTLLKNHKGLIHEQYFGIKMPKEKRAEVERLTDEIILLDKQISDFGILPVSDVSGL